MTRLNAKVTIERDATPRGASGGVKQWQVPETVAVVRASIEPQMGGREQFGNPDWPISKTPYLIKIWYRDDVTPAMRVKYGDRAFAIRSVPVGAQARTLVTLICEETF